MRSACSRPKNASSATASTSTCATRRSRPVVSKPRTLPDTLRHALDGHPDGLLCVAFSGGPDSTALLHALAALPQARARGLRALHVDHGLHSQSGTWAARAAAFCASLGLACEVRKVVVARCGGDGFASAARHARYAAFAYVLSV